MLTKYIPQNIQEKLKAKERALERAKKPAEPLEGYMSFKSMASRTIFVRMCSNKVNPEDNHMIDGGFNNQIKRKPFGFSSIYFKSELNDGDKFGRRPVAGIKNIEVQYKGGFKAIRECTVSWVVPSLDDLEIFQDHFFTVGKTVIVDWGWVYSDGNVDVQLADSFITRETPAGERPQFKVKQEIFTNPQPIISSMNGDYDAIGGQITNFETSLRSDGGFDCTTKIISMGASLFKRPIDAGGNQAGLKVKGKEVREQPPDSIINCILNLQSIILHSSFGIDVDKITSKKESAFRDNIARLVKTKGSKYDYGPKRGYEKDLHDIYFDEDGGYFMNVDDKDNPQVLWTVRDSIHSDFFVNWGWMEDNIISRYTSFLGGFGEDRDVKMTMRSLEPVLDESGNPIPLSKTDNQFDARLDDDFVLDELTNMDEDARSNILKESVKIRKPRLLPPVNPFKFFISNFPSEYVDYIRSDSLKLSFYKEFLTLGSRDKFPKFAESDENRFGSLRNVWVNIKEIQTAFGIKKAESKDTSTNNINPPGTLEVAINSLLTELNANFHNVWDFQIATDFYDSTNIKVVDTSDSEEKNPQYTKYQENSHKIGNSEGDNKGGLGVFQFPSFKKGSIVKNQTLNFKIPDKQALTILYGSNKKPGDSEQEFINGQMQKIFEIKKDTKKDKFLADLESSKYISKGEGGSLETNIGSVRTKPYSKIGYGDKYGIEINPKSWKKWWKIWNPDNEDKDNEEQNTSKSLWSGLVSFFSGGYLEIQENEKTKKPEVVEIKGENVTPLKKYYEFGTNSAILKSDVQKVLKSYLNSSSPIAQFDMSNLVPAELGLEIDGTGGITPFDIIHTEYIQGIYKSDITVENFVMDDTEVVEANRRTAEANFDPDNPEPNYTPDSLSERTTEEQLATTSTRIGPLTFFQIKDVKHTLDESGWKTEITSVMRINRIQRFDKISGLNVQSDKIIPYVHETLDVPLETLQEPFPEDATPDNIDDLTFEDIQEFPDIPLPQTKVLDLNVSPAPLQKEIEDKGYLNPDSDVYTLPGSLFGGRIITDMSPNNIEYALDHASKYGEDKVRNADGTPFNFDGLKPKPEDPPITPSVPLAKAYGKKLELNRMPFADLPIPEKVDQIAIPEVKRYSTLNFHKDKPDQEVDLNEYGTVKQVKGSTFMDMRFAKLNTKEWEAPVEATIQATEPIKEEKLSEVIEVEQPVVEEIVNLKSTYDPSIGSPTHPDETLRDYKLNPTFQLIYEIVPNWYTKAGHTKANSIYGERKQDVVLLRYRQKFWDEVIEAPNETGKTAIRSKADINAKLAEIGEKYKNLGPYDTWEITTGIPYAMYNPATKKADYTENGVKIVLPKGPGAN